MTSIITQPILFEDGGDTYTINDRTSVKQNWDVSPYYYIKVNTIDGWYGTDISTESFPIPHAIGERSGDFFRRGKGFAPSGTIFGRTIPDMVVAAEYLRRMFWNTAARKWKWYESGTQVYMNVRVVNDVSIVESYDQPNPAWAWTVGLRADDPRPRKISDNTLYFTWMT